MLCDIFITYKDRYELFEQSFCSFVSNTPRDLCRLTVVCDGGGVPDFINGSDVDYVLDNRKNRGLGPSINMALSHIDSLKRWDTEDVPFTCYLQDDILYTKDWLTRLIQSYMIFSQQHKIGFASGIECIEHQMRSNLGNGVILKDWIRATCMFARHDYWMSMWPIPRIDPETGRERGRPHDGLGSSVDWWFIRNHENSVCRSGRTNLVVPGLLQHLGYNRSTWLKRELPESDHDKILIREGYLNELTRLGQKWFPEGYE